LSYFKARNEELGLKAINELQEQQVKFHQLDISNQESVDKFAKYLKENHGGLDILINNAGIKFQVNKFF
jgi:carbonyl reductase 1